MKYARKEIIGDCVLYQADCMAILPHLEKVDACLTDPPYGIGEKMKGGTWATKASHYSDMQRWDLEAKQQWIDAILALKVPSIVWGGNYFIMPPSRCWLVWKKPYFPTMADCELAWCSEDANARVFDGLRSYGEKTHPTEKPLPLMTWCIGHLPDTAQTILDPFMGSGTTGVACVKMGRKFIGIEREPEYFEIACKRIREAYAQPDMFIEPPSKMTQENLLIDTPPTNP